MTLAAGSELSDERLIERAVDVAGERGLASLPDDWGDADPLEVIREYAWACLAEQDALAAARQRHARYFAALAEEATATLEGPEEAATLRRFTLGRRRWRNVGIVVGDDMETAERRFFDAWVDRGGSENIAWASPPRARSGRQRAARATPRETGASASA